MDFKTKYFDCWSAAWQLHKKYFVPPENDEGWKQLVNESEKIAEKWKGAPQEKFMQNLLLCVLDEIERTSKERRNK